jgi:hypothetical protein
MTVAGLLGMVAADPDSPAIGIAVLGLTGTGVWQFGTDGGAN